MNLDEQEKKYKKNEKSSLKQFLMNRKILGIFSIKNELYLKNG